jgi:hypothetical protein
MYWWAIRIKEVAHPTLHYKIITCALAVAEKNTGNIMENKK